MSDGPGRIEFEHPRACEICGQLDTLVAAFFRETDRALPCLRVCTDCLWDARGQAQARDLEAYHLRGVTEGYRDGGTCAAAHDYAVETKDGTGDALLRCSRCGHTKQYDRLGVA